MYILSSLNNWYNGQRFDSLAEAFAIAKKCKQAKYQTAIDILLGGPRRRLRVVWTRCGQQKRN